MGRQTLTSQLDVVCWRVSPSVSLTEGGCACVDKNLKWAASRANFDDRIGLFQPCFGEDGGVADLLGCTTAGLGKLHWMVAQGMIEEVLARG